MTMLPAFGLARLSLNKGSGGALAGRPPVALQPRLIDLELEQELVRGARRTKIWELSNHLHCSIVGTCLSTGELRQLVVKAKLAAADISEHDLHRHGVALAGRRDGAAKLLHKALDRRHRSVVARFDKAKTVDEVRALWREAARQGDIPGAYWAVLTHAAANEPLIREVFGEVHMLSHLVGAANRADIRRLAALEAENAALREKLARQQDHLRDGITTRDAKIRELGALLAQRIARQVAEDRTDDGDADRPALTRLVADLEQRLRAEAHRRAALEERLARTVDELGRGRRQRATLEKSERTLREELESVEADFGSTEDEDRPADPASLSGRTLLYVGGRAGGLGHLRSLSERLGARFLHHDGGVDDRSGLLGGLVSRADMVMFPVDCVSHEAVANVKRLCRQMMKPYMPLRSAGMGSFMAGLRRVAAPAPTPSRNRRTCPRSRDASATAPAGSR